MPATDSSRFEELFKDFEDNKDKYGIQTFGISLTTLEEVFLKVASMEDGELDIGEQGRKDKIA